MTAEYDVIEASLAYKRAYAFLPNTIYCLPHAASETRVCLLRSYLTSEYREFGLSFKIWVVTSRSAFPFRSAETRYDLL